MAPVGGDLDSSSVSRSMGVENAPPLNDGTGALPHRPNQRSSLRTRWVILALSCAGMTGVYYSIDIPAALHQQLMGFMPPSGKFEVHFNLLYTVYSIPNVVLPFFGGNIVDRLGTPVCLVGFAALTFLGQLVFAIGTESRSWGVMLVGRTIYGLGGESICVASSTLLSQWFEGKEVAFAMGVSLAVSRLGSVFNNLISPAVANSASTPWAMWVGVIANAMSVCTSATIGVIERRALRKIDDRDQTTALLSASFLEEDAGRVDSSERNEPLRKSSSEDNKHEDSTPVRLSDIKRFGTLFWLLSISCVVVYGCVLPFNNVASGILLERDFFTAPPDDCVLDHPDQCTQGTLQNSTNPSLDKDGDQCPTGNQSPILPTSLNFQRTDKSWHESQYVFESLTPYDVDCGDPFWADACTKNYCDAQNRATEKSGRIMSIPYFISAALSPVLGHVVDRVGRRATLISLASMLLIIVHTSLAISGASPVGPLVGQGIAYALYAAVLWPSVPLTVETKLTGTAFGVITAIQNIGLALFPLIVAGVYNQSGRKYIPGVEFFFVSCAVLGMVVGISLYVVDRRTGKKLNSAQRAATEENYNADYISSLVPSDDADYI